MAEPDDQHEAEQNRREVRHAVVITLIALAFVLLASALLISGGVGS